MSELLLVLHDPKSSVGTTDEWCQSRGVPYRLVLGEDLSHRQNLESMGMIVFGGDMEAWETTKYPWLKKEKTFLRKALDQDRKVLGMCLGAQLLAEQLGAKIEDMKKWELGWYPIEVRGKPLVPLHWHSSSFDLPPGTERLAHSQFCEQQGFQLSPQVKGFQFHAEIDDRRLAHALKGWKPSYQGQVQTPAEILSCADSYKLNLRDWYFTELDTWWNS